MKRWPFALTVLASSSVLVAAAEQASGEAFEKRLSAFYAQAKADRERAGLDGAAARQKYPTPELTLVSGGPEAERCLAPGQTADLTFTGTFPAGSLAGFTCTELDVLELKTAQGRVTAKVRAGSAALPRECALTAVSAMSAIRTNVPAVRIAGKYVWELQLGNGWTTRWTWRAPGCGAPEQATSEWRDKNKVLGTVPVQIEGSGAHWTGSVAQTVEEQQELMRDMQSDDAKKDMAELQRLTQAMVDACGKLEPAKMGACFQTHQEKMNPVKLRMEARDKRTRERAETRKVGCHRVQLDVAADGKVTGRAQGCGAPGETTVTGKIAVAAE